MMNFPIFWKTKNVTTNQGCTLLVDAFHDVKIVINMSHTEMVIRPGPAMLRAPAWDPECASAGEVWRNPHGLSWSTLR